MSCLVLTLLLVNGFNQYGFVETSTDLVSPVTSGDNVHTPFPTTEESLWALSRSPSTRFDMADASLIRIGIVRVSSESNILHEPLLGQCKIQSHKYLAPVAGFVNGKLFMKFVLTTQVHRHMIRPPI